MPNDWELFKPALRKDYITSDYLNKFIGDKKVMLWGASFFIQKVLAEETEKNPNILGIIDRNNASWGKMCGNYKIYPPESIYDLKPDGVIMTIWSNYELIYPSLKEEFTEKYLDTELFYHISVRFLRRLKFMFHLNIKLQNMKENFSGLFSNKKILNLKNGYIQETTKILILKRLKI